MANVLLKKVRRDSDSSIEDDDFVPVKKDTPYSSLNAPMLVKWLAGHYDESPTAVSGLHFIFQHTENEEGCIILLKYGVLKVLFKVQRHEPYTEHKEIQLLCVLVLRNLLGCHETMQPLISTTDVLRITFSIGHRFVSSQEHVSASIQCMLQCARSELNREEIMDSNMIGYCTNFCKKYSKDSAIVSGVLKLFWCLCTTEERIEELCQRSALDTTLQCMKRHTCDAGVLAPGIRFLVKTCVISWCQEYILKKNAVTLIISALRALYDEAELQLEGLKMLQTLSKTKEGYRQISETKGGWQSICQGTTLGNVLFHDIKGEFHNPGWCIGDTKNLTVLDRRKNATLKMSQNKVLGQKQSLWTCRSLMDFMGLSMNGRTLAVTIEHNNAYFELVKSLDLLPSSFKEDRGAWFARLSVYESENSILIQDMVKAVIDMKKKDTIRMHKELEDEHNGGETLKSVYVAGKKVTMKMLEESDVKAGEALDDDYSNVAK